MTTQIIPSPAPEQQPAPLFPPTPKTATRVLEFFTARINNDRSVTEYLRNVDTLDVAQQMANYESARTTGLNDDRSDKLSLHEVESILNYDGTTRGQQEWWSYYGINASTAPAPNHACTVCMAVSDNCCVNSSAKRLFGLEQAT
jgi:hypothetical protein